MNHPKSNFKAFVIGRGETSTFLREYIEEKDGKLFVSHTHFERVARLLDALFEEFGSDAKFLEFYNYLTNEERYALFVHNTILTPYERVYDSHDVEQFVWRGEWDRLTLMVEGARDEHRSK